MEFYSHLEPEPIKLKKHLAFVGEKNKEIILSKRFDKLDKNILADAAYLIGISHDFGKFTVFFQEKLKRLRDENDPLTYHGLISALFAFEVVNEYINAKNLCNEKPYNFLPLIAYFVVKHHHGDLKDIEKDVNTEELFKSGFNKINEQLKDIETYNNQIKQEYSSLLQNYGLSIEKIFNNLERYKVGIGYSEDIVPLIEDTLGKSSYFFRKKDNKNIIYYLLVQLLYSVLIDSDKRHAGHVREIERKELPENLVENHLNKENFKEENKSNINSIRNEIRKSVLKNMAEPESISQKIFTITAPTGTGKTLTSLSAALILRKILKKNLELLYEPRIIYSLPFTSIIDQNFDVFDEVLSQIKDFEEKESQYLLKHHHLSEIFYKTDDMDKEKDIDESLALIESWESEIVVTTFIQLFYTLIGYKNRSLKKFHNIVNSIIILDEVQNIPIEYWNLVREILIAMSDYFNCRTILMTATKPLIFEEGEYKELVDDHETYFKNDELNRVCLHIHASEKPIKDFCDELSDWSKNSYLFVFNTIGSSLEFYKELKAKIRELGLTFKVCYLSTNIIPRERKIKIEKIKEAIKSNQKIIVVSTQLIEAGVDIDCDYVYRDMGPLDSIIQVAGRCNRNKRLKRSNMYLLNLVGENNKPFTGIYDPVLLEIVTQIFKNKSQISESEFLKLINEFFEVAKAKSGIETKLIDSIYELYFYDKLPDDTKRKPISEFKLIKDDYFKVDIFIEVDDNARSVWQEYQEIKSIKDLRERKRRFLGIKKDFYDYVISVPKKYEGQVGFDEKTGIGYISKTEIDQGIGYDLETGFKREDVGGGTLIF